MRKILNIPIANVTPPIEAVLEGQGIPGWSKPEERMIQLAEEAISIYRRKATPIGLLEEISKDDFEIVFNGEGKNENETPVKPIYQNSSDLALFTITVGEEICTEISKLFKANDFAIGSMLDSAASESAEMTAQALENFYRVHLIEMNRFDSRKGILRFSPGYCGWHISAQRKLFQYLKPEDIGVTLNESFLMQPLKSISGVIVAGRKEIFEFEDTFSFCRDCTTHTCKERIKAILEQ